MTQSILAGETEVLLLPSLLPNCEKPQNSRGTGYISESLWQLFVLLEDIMVVWQGLYSGLGEIVREYD